MTNSSESRSKIGNDSRFTSRIIGHHDYVDWYAWRPCSVNAEDYPITLPKLSKDGFTCIEPRYDDSHIGRNSIFDGDYSEGLYDRQWTWAVRQGGNVSIIAIYSWNEYHERSEIEPHIENGTSMLLPFTKTYQYTTLSALYQQYSSDYQVLQENYTSLQSNYSTLQASFDLLNSSFTSLNSRYDTLNSNYASLQTDYVNLMHRYDAFDSSFTQLQSAYNILQMNCNSLTSNLTDLQFRYVDLKLQYGILESNFTSLLSNYNALTVQQNGLNETLNNLEILTGVILALTVAAIILIAKRSWNPLRQPRGKQINSHTDYLHFISTDLQEA